MTNKFKQARKDKDEVDFIPLDDSETESEEWDKTVVGAIEAAVAKGKSLASPPPTKGKSPATTADKGKAPMEHFGSTKKKSVAWKKTKSGGIRIEEPLVSAPPPVKEDIVHIDT